MLDILLGGLGVVIGVGIICTFIVGLISEGVDSGISKALKDNDELLKKLVSDSIKKSVEEIR